MATSIHNKYTYLLISILFSTQIYAQYTQFFDGADTSMYNAIIIETDTSMANVWQVGPPQKSIFDGPASTPNVIVTDTINPYPVNNNSSFGFRAENNFEWGILALQWMQKLDLEEGIDGGIVEVSLDEGLSWTNIFEDPYVYSFYGYDEDNTMSLEDEAMAFTGTDSTWKNIWLCYDASYLWDLDADLQCRYRLLSDSVQTNQEGWMIDNMMLYLTWIHTVEEESQEKYLELSPNPTSGKVEINAKRMDEFHIIEYIEIINEKGQIVQKYGRGPTKFNIDLSQHPEGVYFVKIKTNIREEIQRIILHKN